jgi:protein SCO1/2
MQPRIIAAVCVGAVLVAGFAAIRLAPKMSGSSLPALVEIGGPFKLLNGDGKPVTDRDYRGRYMLVYFGYTHCPDACPTTLNDMAIALDKMPAADRARVVPIFITVDPARDVPSVIGDYVHAFGPEFVGLTGSPDAIAAAEQEFHVYAVKHPLEHGDYAMDHSSIMYVMGPDGVFLGVISDGAKPADIAQRLEAFGA